MFIFGGIYMSKDQIHMNCRASSFPSKLNGRSVTGKTFSLVSTELLHPGNPQSAYVGYKSVTNLERSQQCMLLSQDFFCLPGSQVQLMPCHHLVVSHFHKKMSCPPFIKQWRYQQSEPYIAHHLCLFTSGATKII